MQMLRSTELWLCVSTSSHTANCITNAVCGFTPTAKTNKKTTRQNVESLKVEVAGVEPASKQGTPELSTCLADRLILLLEPGRQQPNPRPSL